jgi:hypothetical protein
VTLSPICSCDGCFSLDHSLWGGLYQCCMITEVTTLAAVLELVVGVAHHAACQSFSLPLLCYHLSSVLVLSPLWVVTGEWSASLGCEQCPFKGHGHTPWHLPHLPDWLTAFLSSYYPVILHLSVSSIHPMFGIFLGPVHLWSWTHSFPSKFLEPHTQPCSMKTWIRINSVRISNLAISYL